MVGPPSWSISDAQGELLNGRGAGERAGPDAAARCHQSAERIWRSLEAILPKLRHGYLAENPIEAQRLAAQHPWRTLLTVDGECFHSATVTGGKPASEGPLALKRELRETESKLAKLETALAQAETEEAATTRAIEQLTLS